MTEKRVLNSGGCGGSAALPPVKDVGVALQRSMLRLRGQHLAEDGSGVNYATLADSQEFAEYCHIAAGLADVDLSTHNQQQRKAFFINIYNALTIHGLAMAPSLPTSVLDLAGFWSVTCYNIGGLVYSLDDLEHGLLRGNKPHPSTGAVCFSPGDRRLEFAVTELDPRIHFALVCGAKSCPAVQVYSSEKLDSHLDLAARSFCSQEVELLPDKNVVKLSKIFQWYENDFAPSVAELLVWITQYLPKEQKQLLHHMMSLTTPTVQYREYNWMLNKL